MSLVVPKGVVRIQRYEHARVYLFADQQSAEKYKLRSVKRKRLPYWEVCWDGNCTVFIVNSLEQHKYWRKRRTVGNLTKGEKKGMYFYDGKRTLLFSQQFADGKMVKEFCKDEYEWFGIELVQKDNQLYFERKGGE